jgi:hypothetical protein
MLLLLLCTGSFQVTPTSAAGDCLLLLHAALAVLNTAASLLLLAG